MKLPIIGAVFLAALSAAPASGFVGNPELVNAVVPEHHQPQLSVEVSGCDRVTARTVTDSSAQVLTPIEGGFAVTFEYFPFFLCQWYGIDTYPPGTRFTLPIPALPAGQHDVRIIARNINSDGLGTPQDTEIGVVQLGVVPVNEVSVVSTPLWQAVLMILLAVTSFAAVRYSLPSTAD